MTATTNVSRRFKKRSWQVYLSVRIGILRKLKLLENVSPTRKVFEIGCAEGMLLHHLRKQGMEVAECEMNRAVAQKGTQAFGIRIILAPFKIIELPHDHFDLVISFHTLEHLRDPLGALEKVATILQPGGALVGEVPCGPEEYENTDHLHFLPNNLCRCCWTNSSPRPK